MKFKNSVIVGAFIFFNVFNIYSGGIAKAHSSTTVDDLLNYGLKLQALVRSDANYGYSYYKTNRVDVFSRTNSGSWYIDFLEGYPFHNSLDPRESFLGKTAEEIDPKRTMGLEKEEFDCINRYVEGQMSLCGLSECEIFSVEKIGEDTTVKRGEKSFQGGSFAEAVRLGFQEELEICQYPAEARMILEDLPAISSRPEEREPTASKEKASAYPILITKNTHEFQDIELISSPKTPDSRPQSGDLDIELLELSEALAEGEPLMAQIEDSQRKTPLDLLKLVLTFTQT